jgi:hypothetical protein
VIVVENVDGLIDHLRAAGEAFTITPDGAIAVEVDDAVIHKYADGALSSVGVHRYRPPNANRPS